MERQIHFPDEQTHKEIRSRSEFIKTIEDFTKYIHKEYLAQSADRSLLICASDGTIGNSQMAMSHVMLGDTSMSVRALKDMMDDPHAEDVFRMARVMSAISGDLDDEIKHQKKFLRHFYFVGAMAGIWTGVFMALTVFGVFHWWVCIINLLLMATVYLNVWRGVSEISRRIGNLRKETKADAVERVKMGMAKLLTFLEHARPDKNEDDDE